MQEAARISAGRLALLGTAVLIIGLALAAAVNFLLPGQDPAGKSMAAGVIFLVCAVLGFGLIIASIVRCFRRSC